ncbi:MAG: hypothetical protein U1E89_20995 [Burkholderiaceae bacterium]
MLNWLAGFTDNFMFWKLVVMLAVVGVLGLINGYREARGRRPL